MPRIVLVDDMDGFWVYEKDFRDRLGEIARGLGCANLETEFHPDFRAEDHAQAVFNADMGNDTYLLTDAKFGPGKEQGGYDLATQCIANGTVQRACVYSVDPVGGWSRDVLLFVKSQEEGRAAAILRFLLDGERPADPLLEFLKAVGSAVEGGDQNVDDNAIVKRLGVAVIKGRVPVIGNHVDLGSLRLEPTVHWKVRPPIVQEHRVWIKAALGFEGEAALVTTLTQIIQHDDNVAIDDGVRETMSKMKTIADTWTKFLVDLPDDPAQRDDLSQPEDHVDENLLLSHDGKKLVFSFDLKGCDAAAKQQMLMTGDVDALVELFAQFKTGSRRAIEGRLQTLESATGWDQKLLREAARVLRRACERAKDDGTPQWGGDEEKRELANIYIRARQEVDQ